MSDSRSDAQPDSQKLLVEMAELVGGLAHELRNPLSTMMVNLQLLAEDLGDESTSLDDTRRRALLKVNVLLREAQRLQTLFDDFLNLTGPFQLERIERDINTIIVSLLEFFEPSAKRMGVTVERVLASGPLNCILDEKLIRQALLNILLNGQQAMTSGGTLTVETRRDGVNAVIIIRDTGIGIAPEDRSRILRPFFSTKDRGTGLGLSLAQRVVQSHGGSLQFESQVGQGTNFTIRFPMTTALSGTTGMGTEPVVDHRSIDGNDHA